MKIRYFAHKQRITGVSEIKIELPADAIFITGYNIEARTDQNTNYGRTLGTVSLIFNGNVTITETVERAERTLNDDWFTGSTDPEYLTNDIQGQSECFCDINIPICLKTIVGLGRPENGIIYYDLTILFKYQTKD